MKKILAVGIILLFLGSSIPALAQTKEYARPVSPTRNFNTSTSTFEFSSIRGGFGIKAVLKNCGENTTDAEWFIYVNGFCFNNRFQSYIPSIGPGQNVTIKTGIILGFGIVTIYVLAWNGVSQTDKYLQGRQYLFYTDIFHYR